MKKWLMLIILVCISGMAVAVDQKYCDMLKQITPGKQIKEVFLLLGPPHTFSQPPNINMNAVHNKNSQVAQPQNTPGNAPTEQQMMLQIVDTDPIMQAFINAGPETNNVLVWSFENNTVSISVKVKGSVVTDVKSNFSC